MNWDSVLDILMPIGTIVGIVGGLLGALTYIKSLRKPKARLRFSNGKKEITFSPHYVRSISTKYYVGPINYGYDASAYQRLIEKYNQRLAEENKFILPFSLSNIGKLQLEDYRVEVEFNENVGSFCLPPTTVKFMESWGEKLPPQDLKINFSKKPQIVYSPEDEHPLNQNDHKDFALLFIPQVDIEKIELNWRIIAKDFHKEGKIFVHLTPRVDELDEIHFKNCERDVPEGGELIEDLIPYIQEMQKLVFDENTK